jgi:hypothetical protein
VSKKTKKNRPMSHKERTALDEKFKALAERWYQDTLIVSNFGRAVEFDSVQEIMKMGKPIIRFILRDIHKSSFWPAVLAHMTGQCPIPEEDAGKIMKMRDHWRQWGREQGHPV